MNCLSETDIQQYLDCELTADRLSGVEQHLKECPSCREVYTRAYESKSQVFTFLDELTSFDIPPKIPVFRIETGEKRLKKYILITAIAASIVLFIGIGIRIDNQKNRQKQMENITKATYEITRNTDLNKLVQNKQIIVVFTNSTGEVIESSLAE
jgi:hypothetical protein